jgi:metal-responsive CopG/Arc/MetJ family transcriptional regulator
MPPEAERRAVSLFFPAHLVEHLDRQAQRNCCSRNAFLRQLVLADLRREQTAARKVKSVA